MCGDLVRMLTVVTMVGTRVVSTVALVTGVLLLHLTLTAGQLITGRLAN